jgi:predicted XRE-type DNA-binding protein
MESPNDDQWVQLTMLLAEPEIASTLYSRQHSVAAKRARIWREARKQGLKQDQIARAFNVSQQAVSKAVKRKQGGLQNT